MFLFIQESNDSINCDKVLSIVGQTPDDKDTPFKVTINFEDGSDLWFKTMDRDRVKNLTREINANILEVRNIKNRPT